MPMLSNVWSLNVPSKAKHLLLRLCEGLLPTYRTIRRNIIVVDEACFSFDGLDVDVIHTIFKCEYARAVWFASPFNFRVDDFDVNSVSDLVSSFIEKGHRDILDLWVMVAWGIWYNKHIRCQEKQGFDPIILINKVLRELHKFQNQNTYVKTLLKRNVEGGSWVAPFGESVKINCHISRFDSNCMFFGCVIRDEMGDVLGSLARKLNLNKSLSIIDAHERTIHESLVFGLDMGFRSIIIESDYLPIIHRLQLTDRASSSLAINIFRSTDLDRDDYDIRFTYIKRDDNRLAESVAEYALYHGRSNIWIEDLPLEVSKDLV